MSARRNQMSLATVVANVMVTMLHWMPMHSSDIDADDGDLRLSGPQARPVRGQNLRP